MDENLTDTGAQKPSLVWFLATREREANAHMHAREKCLSDNIKWMRTTNTTFESSHPVLPISSQTARTRSLTKWGCNPQFVELQFSQLSRARQKLHPQQWIQEVAWLEFYWMKNSTNRWSTVWWSRITTQHYDYEPTIRRATNNELRRTTRLEIDQHQPFPQLVSSRTHEERRTHLGRVWRRWQAVALSVTKSTSKPTHSTYCFRIHLCEERTTAAWQHRRAAARRATTLVGE
jgi:hypothetical protein